MRKVCSQFNDFAIAGLVVAGLCLAFQGMGWVSRREMDLGNKPVDRVFRQVFRRPIPTGVSDMKIAGMSSLSGVVWMRFRVSDVHAFLAAMRANPQMTLDATCEGLDADDMPSQSEADKDHYSHEIGWDAVYQLPHAESFSYGSIPPGNGWYSLIVVDREQRIVYTHGYLF